MNGQPILTTQRVTDESVTYVASFLSQLLFPLLTLGDLHAISRELKAVELKTINTERAELIANHWIRQHSVPSTSQVRHTTLYHSSTQPSCQLFTLITRAALLHLLHHLLPCSLAAPTPRLVHPQLVACVLTYLPVHITSPLPSVPPSDVSAPTLLV
jgi:hypothetical protein